MISNTLKKVFSTALIFISMFLIASIYLLASDYRLNPASLSVFAFSLLAILDIFGYTTILLLLIALFVGYKSFKNTPINYLNIFMGTLIAIFVSSGLFDMHFTGYLLQMPSGGGLLGDAIVSLGGYLIGTGKLTIIFVIFLFISLVIVLSIPVLKLSEDTGFLLLNFNKHTLLEFSLRYFPILFTKHSKEKHDHNLHTHFTKETDSFLFDQRTEDAAVFTNEYQVKPEAPKKQTELFAYTKEPTQPDLTANDCITKTDADGNALITQADVTQGDLITQADITENDPKKKA